jgi:hypothetical protein
VTHHGESNGVILASKSYQKGLTTLTQKAHHNDAKEVRVHLSYRVSSTTKIRPDREDPAFSFQWRAKA